MKNILLIIFTVLFSFFLESQVKHTGKIVKMTEKEITVKSDNINKLFEMGDTLYLQNGDKSVVLRVIFPMQVSAKCVLISGNIRNIKLGDKVISGKEPQKPASSINSFDTFIGFTKNDSIDKALTVLGDSFVTISSNLSQTRLFWATEVEENCYVEISSEFETGNLSNISTIKISSELIKTDIFLILILQKKELFTFCVQKE